MPHIKIDMGQALPPPKEFKPSKYQQALFDWIQNGTGSAIVEAVAGSGKTTTIVQALNLIPETKQAIFLAFNKAIADELKLRVPTHATASTFHSAGLRSWRRQCPKCAIDGNKIRTIMKAMISLTDQADIGEAILHLVSLAKQRGVGVLTPDLPQSYQALIDHFDVDVKPEAISTVIEISMKILRESIRISNMIIDFDDMIYLPVLKHSPIYTYDWVFIDEAQDTNGVRRALAKMMLAKGGRLIAVGDSHQAIYGFTGADSDAIDLIRDEFGCEIFPLSICYRSAKSIVKVAQQFVPEIEAINSAPDGIVAETNFKDVPPNDEDAILCRNTAPLVNLAYEFISQGKGCRILGRDIGRGLARLINQMKANDLDILHDRLMTYCSRESMKFRKEEKEARAQSIEDKVECIYIIISQLPEAERTISGLLMHIDRIFQESNHSKLLTLCTVHKAKGLEWDRVFIYMPGLMPSRYARAPWQMRQEVNLQYVAVTRAKKALYYISGGSK